MKRLSLLRLLLIIALPIQALGATAKSDAKSDNIDYNAIRDHFAAALRGDTAAFASDLTVSSRHIAEVSARIWEQWQQANAGFDEEKLPSVLSPLDGFIPTIKNDHAVRWRLPTDLEPDATLPFFFGTKGTPSDSTGGKYPLIIYLHGSGPKYPEWITGLKLARSFNDAPSIYVIPQIPNTGQYYRWWQKSKQWAWRKLLRQIMLRTDSIDPDAIYITGISEGGYGSQRLASFYADYLAGAGPMAGGEPLVNAPVENLRNTAFTFHTGEQDSGFLRNRLTQITGQALDSIQALYPDGYVHHIEIQPGRGHAVDYTRTTPWLVTHRRNPWPRHVIWENFEMDGLYRDGFHNLWVDARSNHDSNSRTVYRMDIDGNTIDIRVSLVSYTVTESDSRFGFPIGLRFARTAVPATTGRLTVYLNDSLVNLNKKIRLKINGKEVFKGRLTPRLSDLVNSCARYFDPRRLYPASITVDLRTLAEKDAEK